MIQHGGFFVPAFQKSHGFRGEAPHSRYGIPEPQGTGEGPAGPSQPGPGRKRLLDSQLALLDHFSHLNSIYYVYIYIYICMYIYIYIYIWGGMGH